MNIKIRVWYPAMHMFLIPDKVDLGDAEGVLQLASGLVDSEGRDIFDGDIVSLDERVSCGTTLLRIHHMPHAIVRWQKATASFIYETNVGIRPLHTASNIKVLGNIFNNPELIEKAMHAPAVENFPTFKTKPPWGA